MKIHLSHLFLNLCQEPGQSRLGPFPIRGLCRLDSSPLSIHRFVNIKFNTCKEICPMKNLGIYVFFLKNNGGIKLPISDFI